MNSALTKVVIPDKVTNIGIGAFRGCTSLTSVVIPDSLTSIGECAFMDCNNLEDINFNGTRTAWNNITKGSGAIPSGVTIHCTDAVFTFEEEVPSDSDSSDSGISYFQYPDTDTSDSNDTAPAPVYGDGTSSSARAVNVTASALTKVIKQTKEGSTAKLYIASAGAMLDKSVIDRLSAPVAFTAPNYTVTVDPAKLTEKVSIAFTVKPSAPMAQNTFEKFFKEPVAAISCAQRGSFGGQVYIDIKPDKLSNIDVNKTMYVFSWNPNTNSYKRVGTAVKLKNGMIRCYTTRGYDLVISNSETFTAK